MTGYFKNAQFAETVPPCERDISIAAVLYRMHELHVHVMMLKTERKKKKNNPDPGVAVYSVLCATFKA